MWNGLTFELIKATSICWMVHHGWLATIDLQPTLELLTFDGTDDRSHQWIWLLDAPGSFLAPMAGQEEIRANIATPLTQPPRLDLQTLSTHPVQPHPALTS